MEDLYAGIDLGSVTHVDDDQLAGRGRCSRCTSRSAEKAGVERSRLGGTLQNDILKEYQAQKEFVFPPRPSMRLVADTIRFCAAEMPRWHPVSISGYHIREAGSTAAQELAFTLANGFAYVELARPAGSTVDEFAPRLSFFFNAHIDFFEEIAKYRAARRIWARWMRDRYGATDERSMHAALPHPDRRGVAHRPAARGQHRPDRHRGAGRRARRHAEPAHQLDGRGAGPAHRQGGAHRAAHPAGHRLRDRRGQRGRSARRARGSSRRSPTSSSAQAEAIFAYAGRAWAAARCSRACYAGIDDGWFQGEIADAAYQFERKLNRGRRVAGRRQRVHRGRRRRRRSSCCASPTSTSRRRSSGSPR